MTPGENIKMLRESKYMSILDVQEITGLSKSTIRDIERDTLNSLGKSRVHSEIIFIIGGFYNEKKFKLIKS